MRKTTKLSQINVIQKLNFLFFFLWIFSIFSSENLKHTLELSKFSSIVDGTVNNGIKGRILTNKNSISIILTVPILSSEIPGGFRYPFNINNIFKDDRVEIEFIKDDDIYNFIVNTWGSRGKKKNEEWDWDKKWKTKVERDKNSFLYEITIPFSSLGIEKNCRIKFNLFVFQEKPKDIFTYAPILGNIKNYDKYPILEIKEVENKIKFENYNESRINSQTFLTSSQNYISQQDKKIISIGWFCGNKNSLKEIKENGANTVYYYLHSALDNFLSYIPQKKEDLPSLLSFLDEAQKNNLKVVIGISSILGAENYNQTFKSNEYTYDYLKAVIQLFNTHPAVFGWWLGEEPEINNFYFNEAERLTLLYTTIKNIDSKHQIFVCHCHKEYIQVYQESGDIFCVELYYLEPRVGFDSLTKVFQDLEDVRSYLKTPKILFIVPQVFSWKEERNYGWDPTIEEIRGMVYAGILGGAKGIIFFRWHENENSLKNWSTLKKEISSLLLKIEKLGLTNFEIKWEKENNFNVNNPEIELWKNNINKRTIFVLNKTKKKLPFVIKGNFCNDTIIDISRDRKILNNKDTIEGEIEPFDLVVYQY